MVQWFFTILYQKGLIQNGHSATETNLGYIVSTVPAPNKGQS